jgi:ComEC/Rec2-related protein
MVPVLKNLYASDTLVAQIVPIENVRIGEKYSQWEAEAKFIGNKNITLPLTGKVRFYISNERVPEIGRKYFLRLRREDVLYFNLKNDEFSFYTNLLKNEIIVQCFVNNYDLIETNEHDRIFFRSYVQRLREILSGYAFKKINDKDVTSMGMAMWIGDERYLNSKLYSIFSMSGVIHILSVSGMHVGFIYLIFNIIISKFLISRVRRFFLISILLILYSILCGLGIPVLRASLMFIIAESLYFWPYHVHNKNLLVLCAVAFVFLLIDPFLIYDLSFQLSFSSMAGLLLLYPAFDERLENIQMNICFKKYLVDPLFITLSTSITTLPFILHSFHAFTFVSFISNIIIVPLSFLFMLSFLLIIIPFDIMGQIPIFMGRLLLKISEFFSGYYEFASLRYVDFGNLDFVFSMVVIFLFSYIMLSKDKKYGLALIIILFIWMLLSTIDAYHHKRSKYFYCENYKGNLNVLVKNKHLLYEDLKGDASIKMNYVMAESNYPYLFKRSFMMAGFNKCVFILNDSLYAQVHGRYDTTYVFTKKWKNFKKLSRLFEQNKEVKIVFMKRNSDYFYKD